MRWQWWEALVVALGPLVGLGVWAAWERAAGWWRSPERRQRAADARFARSRRARTW